VLVAHAKLIPDATGDIGIDTKRFLKRGSQTINDLGQFGPHWMLPSVAQRPPAVTPLQSAMIAAEAGTEWRCLIWLCDYLLAETGRDPGRAWRHITRWDERTALREMLRLDGTGDVLVERSLDAGARLHGWVENDGPRQGAVMVGVYRSLSPNGSPAIFDKRSRWILPLFGGGWVSTKDAPDRMWEVPC
jgi:hypothetical protein